MVRAVPSVETLNTKLWYSRYQALVLGLQLLGSLNIKMS